MQPHHYELILSAMLKLLRENAELRKQIDAIKLDNVSASVADHIDAWLSRPYNGPDESQDIKEFSREITSFIASQLKM